MGEWVPVLHMYKSKRVTLCCNWNVVDVVHSAQVRDRFGENSSSYAPPFLRYPTAWRSHGIINSSLQFSSTTRQCALQVYEERIRLPWTYFRSAVIWCTYSRNLTGMVRESISSGYLYMSISNSGHGYGSSVGVKRFDVENTDSLVKSSVKSSQVVGLRTRVASIRTLIFSSPHPYAGSGEVWMG